MLTDILQIRVCLAILYDFAVPLVEEHWRRALRHFPVAGRRALYYYYFMGMLIGLTPFYPYVPKKITIGLSAWITFEVESESKYNFM